MDGHDVTNNGNVPPVQPGPVFSSCSTLFTHRFTTTTRSHRVERVTSSSRFILHCHKPSENPLFCQFCFQSLSFNPFNSLCTCLNNLVSSLFLSMMVTPPKVLRNNFLLPYEIHRTGRGNLSWRYLSCYYRRGTVIELQHHHPHP